MKQSQFQMYREVRQTKHLWIYSMYGWSVCGVTSKSRLQTSTFSGSYDVVTLMQKTINISDAESIAGMVVDERDIFVETHTDKCQTQSTHASPEEMQERLKTMSRFISDLDAIFPGSVSITIREDARTSAIDAQLTIRPHGEDETRCFLSFSSMMDPLRPGNRTFVSEVRLAFNLPPNPEAA